LRNWQGENSNGAGILTLSQSSSFLFKFDRVAAQGMYRMAETITCPHCKGTGVNYIIASKDGKSAIESVSCVVCSGKGVIAAPTTEMPKPPEPAPEPAELWPILVPLGIFFLFFLFLWL
jgi:hypothetical protein